jgi:hypothetical protein
VSNTVRILRSTTAGATPSSLVSGQIAVNEADGRFFYRSAAGVVTPFSSIASYATTASFPATGATGILYLASDTSRAYQWNGAYIEVGVSSGVQPATTTTLGGVVVGSGLSASSDGTVSANVVSVAGRTGAVSISSGDVSGLATVATSGSAADLSGTLDDARLSSNVAIYGVVNAALGQSAGAIDSMPRISAANQVTAGTNQALFSFFTPTATITVSQVSMFSTNGAAASGLTLARMGLYTYTEGGVATLVARTASDTSLFTAQSTAYTRSFDTTGGWPATYQLIAGVRHAVAYLCVGTTQPQLAGRVGWSAFNVLTPRMTGGSVSNLSDLPTSLTPLNNAQAPFARLS